MTDLVRTCATCACSLVLEPPRIRPLTMNDQQWASAQGAKPQRICRWFPPQTIPGVGIMQQPVADTMVCWQWQPPHSRPGQPWGWFKIDAPA